MACLPAIACWDLQCTFTKDVIACSCHAWLGQCSVSCRHRPSHSSMACLPASICWVCSPVLVRLAMISVYCYSLSHTHTHAQTCFCQTSYIWSQGAVTLFLTLTHLLSHKQCINAHAPTHTHTHTHTLAVQSQSIWTRARAVLHPSLSSLPPPQPILEYSRFFQRQPRLSPSLGHHVQRVRGHTLRLDPSQQYGEYIIVGLLHQCQYYWW